MGDSFLDTDLNDLLRKGYAELEEALGQEDVAEQQLALAQSKVARLSQRIVQLAIASDDQTLIDAVTETSLTDAVRSVLKAAEKPLTAPEIRERMGQIGFDVSVYQNFLATLYLTLKRLEKQKEAQEIKHDGKKIYVWQFTRSRNPLAENRERILGLLKPRPDWYEKITENGTKPLDFSKLTRGQQREARELGIVPVRPPRPSTDK